jgi:hypothetical protein
MVISRYPWEVVMLEKYYIRPTTIDRIHESWIASVVDRYVSWMAERRYTDSSVSRRIPIMVSFGEFAKATRPDLPRHYLHDTVVCMADPYW